MKRIRDAAIIGVTLAAMFAFVPGAFAAHTAHGHGIGTYQAGANGVRVSGTIADFSASSLTIATKSGNKVVQLTSATKYIVNGAQSAARPTFTKGEAVRALATQQSDGSLVATVVAVGKGSGRGLGANVVRVAGTIAGSTASTLTVKTATGNTTVQLATTTKYVVNGVQSAAKPAFTKGQAVQVFAQKQTNGSLVAQVVAIGQGLREKGARVAGTVASFTATSLSITTSAGVKTVQLTTSTKYVVNGTPSATKPAFTKGQAVQVFVRQETNGSLTALIVVIGKGQFANRVRVSGTIADSTANTLTVKTATGNQVVQLTSTTTYEVNGTRSATKPTFVNGQAVEVSAIKQTNGSLVAQQVQIGQDQDANHANRVRIAGTIADFSATSLSINTTAGVKVVQLTSTTRYIVNRAVSATKPTFTKGQAVRVSAQQQTNGSLVALTVSLGSAG